MADKNIYWSKTGLTGGAATDLDSIDGTGLQDGEIAHVWISNVLYIYLLDVDSGAAESSPAIIAPDTNAGDKRWILQSYYSGSGTLYTDHIAESTAAHGVEIDGLTIKDSGFALGSDADGDMYYRASSVLARLAKGTEYYRLAMNAAGTAPTWRVGGSTTSSSRVMDAATTDPAGSATIAIGAGANSVLIMSYLGGKFGVGFAGRTGGQFNIYETSAGVWTPATALVTLYEAAGKTQVFAITSWSESALNGTWTRTGATASATGYFYILSW